MKEMIKTLNQARKSAPREFWNSVLFVFGWFGFIWACMWIEAIINGKV